MSTRTPEPAGALPDDSIAILGGRAGIAVGLSFIPLEALRGMKWGGKSAPSVLVAACSDLSPDFVFVPSWEPWADEVADRVSACGVDVFWAVPGPFGMVAERDGWTPSLRRTLGEPARLRSEMRSLIPGLFESVKRGVAMGARAIVITEDMAGTGGMLFAPDFAMDELMPLLGALAQTASEEAVPSILHSDGDIRVLLRSVRKAGFAGLHVGSLGVDSFEVIFDLARKEGLGVLGGLDPNALRSGLPAAAVTGSHAGLLALKGGLLICDDGGITTPEEVTALVSAIEAARDCVLPRDAFGVEG